MFHIGVEVRRGDRTEFVPFAVIADSEKAAVELAENKLRARGEEPTGRAQDIEAQPPDSVELIEQK